MADSVTPNPSRRLPTAVWALGTVSLLTDAAADLVYPLLPALLGSAMALGAMEGAAELVASFVKAWAGRVADRKHNHGRFVVLGYGLAALAKPLVALCTTPLQIVLARTMDRTGKGLRSGPRDAILTEATPEAQRGLAFGVHRMMDNLGAVIGPLLAFGLLSFGLSVRKVIAFSIVPGALAVLVAAWAVRGVVIAKKTHAETSVVPLSDDARLLLVATGVFALGASADSFLLFRLSQLGLPLRFVPIAWVTLQLGKALLNAPGGALADRIGPRPVLLMSWFVYALAYVAFAFAPGYHSFWLVFALYAVHYGLGEGAEKALMAKLVDPRARGAAFGAQHAVHGAMLLPANLAFGFLVTLHPRVAFLGAAGAALLGTLLLTRTNKVRKDAPA